MDLIPWWDRSPEEEMAIHSSIPACRIPWAEKPGGLSPKSLKELDMTEHTRTHTYTHFYKLILAMSSAGRKRKKSYKHNIHL